MTKKVIVSLHKTIRIKWIPMYEGRFDCYEIVPECELCESLGCDDCPVFENYGITCNFSIDFGYVNWKESNNAYRKHNPESLIVLQNLIRLLPEKKRTRTEKKYLLIKGDR